MGAGAGLENEFSGLRKSGLRKSGLSESGLRKIAHLCQPITLPGSAAQRDGLSVPLTLALITSRSREMGGGKMDAPVVQCVFWCSPEGPCCHCAASWRGLNAPQGAAVSTGIPFTLIILVMCYCLFLALKKEQAKL
jgi:hypothetical protein